MLLLQVEHDSSLQLLLVHLLKHGCQILHLLRGEVSLHNTSVQQSVTGLSLGAIELTSKPSPTCRLRPYGYQQRCP